MYMYYFIKSSHGPVRYSTYDYNHFMYKKIEVKNG